MEIPKPVRPLMKNYGIATDEKGLLTWTWVDEQLTKARNYWIASTRPDNTPHVAPVWGMWLDGALYFGSDHQARKTRNLIERPQVVVHLESGDEVVIVEGVASLVTSETVPANFSEKYGAKYNFAPDPHLEVSSALFRVAPKLVFAWRESDFPNTATRWVFA